VASAKKSTQSSDQGDLIQFFVAVGIRGPIASGSYQVGQTTIIVSYPPAISVAPRPVILPQGLSTLFEVSWRDVRQVIARKLQSKKAERHFPIFYALEKVNKLLLAYKLVRIGHLDGWGLRTIGKDDVLISFSMVNGQPVGDLSAPLRTSWTYEEDPLGTTSLASGHIGTDTFPVARRYVRCFELLEHGYYTEALIVTFSILDDLVQQALHDHLSKKGMTSEEERKALLRGIKEQRLKLYLGQLLKILTGKSLKEMWPHAETALEWLNRSRNNAAHQGYRADYSTAAKAIYVSIKVLVILHQNKMIDCEFPVEMFRHAKITAAWTENPPKWVPQGKEAEAFDFT
jgi:hypothetical protein